MKPKTTLIWLFVGIAGMALLLGACSAARPEEAAVQEVTFTAVEYSFDGPDTIPAGWTQLTLDNQGELAHDLWMIKVTEGTTPDDVMAALESDGIPAWATFYGQTTAKPGEQTSYFANLTPGSYVILSFGEAEDAPPDAFQGMLDMITVTKAERVADEAAVPQAATTLDLVDYSFVTNGDFGRGQQLVQVKNAGSTLHEAVIAPLEEGTTFADFLATLVDGVEEEPEGVGEPLAFMMLSPDVTTVVPVDFLEPGSYVLICFIPNEEGQPHFELGMVQEITVQ